ncbi:MAG: hypothetical protein ACKVLB_06060 [Burkholderiales bacterium]
MTKKYSSSSLKLLPPTPSKTIDKRQVTHHAKTLINFKHSPLPQAVNTAHA